MFSDPEKKSFLYNSRCASGFFRIKLHEIYLLYRYNYYNYFQFLPSEYFFKLHQTAWETHVVI